MKRILIFFTLLASGIASYAQSKAIVVDSGVVQTVSGVGDYVTVTYAFAKGDKVSITGHASKELERMKVVLYPGTVIGHVKYTKDVSYSFTMSEAGICMFTFISDRGGKNTISYLIARVPASAATDHYVTKVTWDKTSGTSGTSVPHQAQQ